MKRKRKLIFLLIFLNIVLLYPLYASAQLFSGSLDYSYNTFVQKGSAKSKTSDFQQAYNINNEGLLLRNSKIGSYSLGFGFTNSKSNSAQSDPDPEDEYNHTKNSSNLFSYNISSSFIPTTFSPITFQFSRHSSELDNTLNPQARGTSFNSKTKTNNYRATWRLISKKMLPTMSSQFGMVDTLSESQFDLRNDLRRTAKFDFTKNGLRTNYRLNYDFEDFYNKDSSGRETSATESHATGINISKQMSRAMSANGAGTYSKTDTGDNINLGGSLSARHSDSLNSNYSNNLTRTQTTATTVSDRFTAAVRYNPTTKFSSNGSYSYNYESSPAHSNTLSLGGSYRPERFLNMIVRDSLVTNFSSSFSLLNNDRKKSVNHNYSLGADYSKPFNLFQMSSFYSTTYSGKYADRGATTNTTGNSSKVITGWNNSHTTGMGLTSRELKYATTLSSNLRFSKTFSKDDGQNNGSEGYSTTIGLTNSFIKMASLNGTFTYNNTLAQGNRNQTYNANTNMNLSLYKGIVLNLGYNFAKSKVNKENGTETKSWSISSAAPFLYTTMLTRNLRFNLVAKYDRSQLSQSNTTTEVFNVGPHFTYSIGLLELSFEYNFNETKTKSSDSRSYSGYYNMMFRGTRRF